MKIFFKSILILNITIPLSLNVFSCKPFHVNSTIKSLNLIISDKEIYFDQLVVDLNKEEILTAIKLKNPSAKYLRVKDFEIAMITNTTLTIIGVNNYYGEITFNYRCLENLSKIIKNKNLRFLDLKKFEKPTKEQFSSAINSSNFGLNLTLGDFNIKNVNLNNNFLTIIGVSNYYGEITFNYQFLKNYLAEVIKNKNLGFLKFNEFKQLTKEQVSSAINASNLDLNLTLDDFDIKNINIYSNYLEIIGKNDYHGEVTFFYRVVKDLTKIIKNKDLGLLSIGELQKPIKEVVWLAINASNPGIDLKWFNFEILGWGYDSSTNNKQLKIVGQNNYHGELVLNYQVNFVLEKDLDNLKFWEKDLKKVKQSLKNKEFDTLALHKIQESIKTEILAAIKERNSSWNVDIIPEDFCIVDIVEKQDDLLLITIKDVNKKYFDLQVFSCKYT